MSAKKNIKIGLITIYDLKNYGNRLQNYAIVNKLQSMGAEADTLIISDYGIKGSIKKVFGLTDYTTWNDMQEAKTFVSGLSNRDLAKYRKLREFSYKYCNIKKATLLRHYSLLLSRKYSLFMVGSDQVWNPFIAQANQWEFLTFTRPEKRIALSSSFGVNDLGPYNNRIAKNLKAMKSISVRETSGVQLVRELCGRNAKLLIDPVLALNTEEWNRISAKPEDGVDDDSYLLTYFLGNVTKEYRSAIEEYAFNNHLKIVSINHRQEPYAVEEFVYRIAHAKIVFTDSFHASAFSFIYDRPFVVFDRSGDGPDMSSRIISFLEQFHLEDRYYKNVDYHVAMSTDFSVGKRILRTKQSEFTNFITEAIHCCK